MPRFSANLSMLYNEHGFTDRFAAAAADGFKAVEYLGPYAETIETIGNLLADNDLKQVLFNLPVGDWANGERGFACLPGREAEFREGVDKAIDYARALGCAQVNCLSGIVPEGADRDGYLDTLAENLSFAAPRLAEAGIRLLIEPINHRDIPGFAISTTDQAEAMMARVGSDNVFIQYDFYHMQIMQGDLVPGFARLQDKIAHVQIADNPGRHEPGSGEIHYPFIFAELDRLGYDGWVGAEYVPSGPTSGTLGWRPKS